MNLEKNPKLLHILSTLNLSSTPIHIIVQNGKTMIIIHNTI